MRNLRKLTAVVLAVALVLTSMAAVFAATEDTTATTATVAAVVNGDKAAVLKDLGLYTGKDLTNPVIGLEDPLEVQQALCWLATEFGYKAEADKLADEDADKALAKFADAKDVSEYAKKVVAYSAENGIIAGEKTNDGKLYIRPTASVKATRFATFMVKALGYDLTGSFTEAVAQLAEVEGSKIDADVDGDLTRDAAVGMMYGVLTAKTEAGKTVAENLLAADSSLQATLSKNSLLPINGTLAVDTVMAVGNNLVKVTLKEDAAATAADFSIVKRDTTTAVAVKNATKEAEKVFVLETDALASGEKYTLTANGTSVNFTGIATDNSAPTIVKVTAPDTNTFEIEFSDKMDYATATDVANYTWDKSLKTVKAELNGDRNKVKLTTDVAKRNVTYNLTVANVKNSDGKAITKSSRNIQAIEDKTAPRLSSSVPQNNRMVVLKFDDANGMNKAALETAANYSISDLAITSVTAYDVTGDDDKYETVVLMTETQTQAKTYTLTVQNLVDNSVLANPLAKTTRTFRGAPEDKTAPFVKAGSSVKAENNTLVEIEFTDNNAMDNATLEDISNYSITYGNNEVLDVISAKAASTSYPDTYTNKKVTLTTAAQEDKKNYTLHIKGVADEFGNVIKQVGGKDAIFRFTGSDVDTQPPYVKDTQYVSSTQVKLIFDANLDEATAEDPTNYSFNKDIGSPIKAELKNDKEVTLTTQALTDNTTYTITMNNVEDKFGNAMSNVKLDFLYNAEEIDSSIPTLSYIWAANNQEIHLYFDEKIKTYPTDLDIRAVDGDSFGAANTTVKMTYAGQLDDGKTLVYKVKNLQDKIKDIDYVISKTDANRFADPAGNKILQYTDTTPLKPAISDRAVFTGDYFDNEAPRVEYLEQINVKKIKVTFSEPVQLPASAGNFTFDKGNTDISDSHQTEWYVKRNTKFKVDEKVTLDFSTWAKDLVGIKAIELDDEPNTIYYTYLTDEVDPVITGVVAIDNNTIEVTYDEDIDKAGTYKVTELYYDNNGKEQTRPVALAVSPTSVKDNVVTVNTKTELALKKNYYLVPTAPATDVAGNREEIRDIRWDFGGSDVINKDLVKGVGTTNAKEVYVSTTRPMVSVVSVTEKGDPDVTINIPAAAVTFDTDKKRADIKLPLPTISGKEYVVKVAYDNAATDTEEFSFDGNTPDIGLELVRTSSTVVTLDITGYEPLDYNAQIATIVTSPMAMTIIPGDRTTTGFTFGQPTTPPTPPATAAEYYVYLTRSDDPATVVYAAKVTPTPDANYQLLVDAAETAVTNAETLNTVAAINASKAPIAKLAIGDQTPYLDRLIAIVDEAVVNAESSTSTLLADVTNAQALLNTLPASANTTDVQALQARLVAIADNAVTIAEDSTSAADIAAAQKLVDVLPAGADKTDLQTRIDAI